MHPTPYTAAAIRDATRAGRTYTWKVEAAGKPTVHRVARFVAVDRDGATIESGVRGPDAGAPETGRVTWEELRQHAEFPLEVVTTREETLKLPAGTFPCVVYVVRGTDGMTGSFYFARTMPGAPVLAVTEKDGARVSTMTLVAYAPGK